MTATITRALPFADYLALPGLHFSTLKAIDTSPLHYQRALRFDRDSDALRLGRVTHAMILTPDLPLDVVTWEGPVRRGKAWDAFQEEHAGKTIVAKGELKDACAMRDAVQRHPIARKLLERGEPEVTTRFEIDGLPCRARIDWLRPCGSIVELKTTRAIHPRTFQREAASFNYHAQLAFYAGGLAAAQGRDAPELPMMIAVEKFPPFDVAVYRIGYDTLEAGQRKIDAWVRRVAECNAARAWPGVAPDVLDMKLPEWAIEGDAADVDLSGIGG